MRFDRSISARCSRRVPGCLPCFPAMYTLLPNTGYLTSIASSAVPRSQHIFGKTPAADCSFPSPHGLRIHCIPYHPPRMDSRTSTLGRSKTPEYREAGSRINKSKLESHVSHTSLIVTEAPCIPNISPVWTILPLEAGHDRRKSITAGRFAFGVR